MLRATCSSTPLLRSTGGVDAQRRWGYCSNLTLVRSCINLLWVPLMKPNGRIPEVLLKNAKLMRLEPTSAEQKMWRLLRGGQLGMSFRRQHPVLKRYILDFYCPKVRLAIELDGFLHDEPEAQQYDEQRTHNLAKIGIDVTRDLQLHSTFAKQRGSGAASSA